MSESPKMIAESVLVDRGRALCVRIAVGSESVLIFLRRHIPRRRSQEPLPELESIDGVAAVVYPGAGNWLEYGPIQRWCSENAIPFFVSHITQALSEVQTSHIAALRPVPSEMAIRADGCVSAGEWRIAARLRSLELPDRVSLEISIGDHRAIFTGGSAEGGIETTAAAFEPGCDLLILERTSDPAGGGAARHGPSEEEIGAALSRSVRESRELALVNFATLNLARFMTVYRAMQAAGRSFLIDAYLAETLVGARRAGFAALPDPFDRESGLLVLVPDAIGEKARARLEDYPSREADAALRDLARRPERYGLLFRELTVTDPLIVSSIPFERSRYYHCMWGPYLGASKTRPYQARWRELISEHAVQVEVHHADSRMPSSDADALISAIAPGRVVRV